MPDVDAHGHGIEIQITLSIQVPEIDAAGALDRDGVDTRLRRPGPENVFFGERQDFIIRKIEHRGTSVKGRIEAGGLRRRHYNPAAGLPPRKENMERFPYRRIVVIGSTGSGKSTLAERISNLLGLPFVELDALYWQPNWKPTEPEELRIRVKDALAGGAWVVAGNYHVVRDLIWPSAEAIIWLDYSLPLIFWRLFIRTIRRSVLQEELWNGNRERFWWHLKVLVG